MKNLAFIVALSLSRVAWSDSSPDLTGVFVGNLLGDVYKISQSQCESIEIAYGKNLASVGSGTIRKTDGINRPSSDGNFCSLTFTSSFLEVQLFKDQDSRNPAGPKLRYSLYETAGGTFLVISTFLDDEVGDKPSKTFYKKQ